MYYFINKEIKKLVIAIVYVDNVYFMSSEDFLLLLELKQKFIIKWKYHELRETKEFLRIHISYNCKD